MKINLFALRPGDRMKLKIWASESLHNQEMATAAQIVLMAAEGVGARDIAQWLKVSERAVSAALRKYRESGIWGLIR